MTTPTVQIVNNDGAVVIQVMPVWGRMAIVQALSGLPHYTIRKLYNEHKVRARKEDPNKDGCAVVFNVQDVLDWLANDAPAPKPFKLPEALNG